MFIPFEREYDLFVRFLQSRVDIKPLLTGFFKNFIQSMKTSCTVIIYKIPLFLHF